MFKAFAREFVKLAKQTVEEKVQEHLTSDKPDWKAFEKSLRSQTFRKAVVRAAESDPKLKKYVTNFGGYVASKDLVAKVEGSTGKTYKVKKLPNGRLGCNCKDWQFIHSVQGGDCKHVKALKQNKTKVAALAAMGVGATLANRVMNQRERGKKSRQTMLAARKHFGGESPMLGLFPLIPT